MQRRTMFIQTETTPNADSLKFIPGQPVSPESTHEFLDAGSSSASPLADRLFHLPDVRSVFFGPDFISVNKTEDGQWSELKPEIYSIIMEHFTAGRPLFEEGRGGGAEDTRILDSDSEVVAMIKELLETRVRPAIMEDGGDIEYRGFNEESGVVQLSLKGSCRGCESSSVTLKSGIERMLMHYIPEVKEVEQVRTLPPSALPSPLDVSVLTLLSLLLARAGPRRGRGGGRGRVCQVRGEATVGRQDGERVGAVQRVTSSSPFGRDREPPPRLEECTVRRQGRLRYVQLRESRPLERF